MGLLVRRRGRHEVREVEPAARVGARRDVEPLHAQILDGDLVVQQREQPVARRHTVEPDGDPPRVIPDLDVAQGDVAQESSLDASDREAGHRLVSLRDDDPPQHFVTALGAQHPHADDQRNDDDREERRRAFAGEPREVVPVELRVRVHQKASPMVMW